MPTFSDSFDGTYPMLSYQYTEDDITITNTIAEGRLNIYKTENYWSWGTCFGKTRFNGNITWEICFSINNLLEPVEACLIGFASHDDTEDSDEFIDIDYDPPNEIKIWIGGVKKVVLQDVKIWVKFIQTTEAGIVESWFKEDGGTYELLQNDLLIPYFANPEGCIWQAYLSVYSAYPDYTLRIWDMNTTADYIANLAMDNWPTRMQTGVRALQIDSNSALSPYVPEPTYDFVEEFNEPYDPDNLYYTDPDMYTENGSLVMNHAQGSGDVTDWWYMDVDEYFAKEIEYVVRLKIRSLGTGVYFFIYLYDPDWSYFYEVRFIASAVHGLYTLSAYTNAAGAVQTFVNVPDFALFTESWYEVKIQENSDSTTSVYIRQDGFDWYFLGTTTPLPTPPLKYGARPRVLLDTFTADKDEVPQNIEIDELKINSVYSTLEFNWFGALEPTIDTVHALFTSGWGTYIAYDFTDFSDTLDELDFCAPLPSYSVVEGSYLDLTYTDTTDFKIFATIKDDFVFDITFAYVMDPTASQPYLAWRFYINDVEIWFGHHHDGTSDRAGVCIDGTWYYHSDVTWSVTSSNRFVFTLVDNELVVTIQQSTTAAETVYSDTDFLGSPAEYVTRDFTYIRSPGTDYEYTRIASLYLLAEEALVTDLEGWLEHSFEGLIAEFILVLTPPAIADPGFFFHRTNLVGGTEDALDSIDPTNLESTGQELTETSACLVITDTNDIYIYKACNAPGQVESVPDIIIPDNNPGDWYWERVHSPQFRPLTAVNYADVTANEILSMPGECKNDIPFPVVRYNATSEVYQRQIQVQNEGTVLKSGFDADQFTVWFVPVIALKAEPE